MHTLWQSLKMFLWLTLLTGIIYPLIVTIIAQTAFKHKADGSLLTVNGKVVGSSLIAQKFVDNKYFWPRPSANDYNGLASGGSNLGPTSKVLKKTVAQRKAALIKAHGETSKIPSELLFASASGLDPHISVETAYFQSERVAKARGKDKAAVDALIQKHIIPRQLGFLGNPMVNVLELNIALDQM